MTPAMLSTLFAAYAAGSRAAFSKLVEGNIGLAHHVAKRYQAIALRHGYDREDVIGAALGGLTRAVIHYDASKGTLFSTFAVDTIRAAIQKDLGLRRTETVTRSVQNPMTGEYEERKLKQVRPHDSMSKPRGDPEGEGGGEATLGDFLTSGQSVETELQDRTERSKRDRAIELAGTFATTLDAFDRRIWEVKILANDRTVKPEALGCNNAARVSQHKATLLARFRRYLTEETAG